MSVQFGRWSLTGEGPSPDYLKQADDLLVPYGPDGGNCFGADGIAMLYRALHTTKEARCESQPVVTSSGAVITWDGRLDNRTELINLLNGNIRCGLSDSSIVASAYEWWGVDCFARLIGDWALAIWDPHDRSVILARDFVGVRHLYYSFEQHQITWSTILDPLVLFAGRSFPICEEYLAGWLAYFPAANLTPYAGIHSVPPSSFVKFWRGKSVTVKYWDFDPGRKIRYRTDSEYEEHFRKVFSNAVLRRLRSDRPVLAELSGGMDSSAIVCMADQISDHGANDIPRVETLSYYDDSEPDWNERPYFTKVEEKRGRAGHHIDISSQESFVFDLDRFIPIPASAVRRTDHSKRFATGMTSQSTPVLLSGIGGDEVLGGIPTPLPELEDLLVRARWGALAYKLKDWALTKRRPWLHLLFDTVRPFFPSSLLRTPEYRRPPCWLEPAFVRRNRAALQGYEKRLRAFGPRPSFQNNLATLEGLRRQLGCSVLIPSAIYETRYPYLDRDLLEFLYAIPREQLVRPGQRRSLMRRALAGIVPIEVLQRQRKASVSRSPVKTIGTQWSGLAKLTHDAPELSRAILDTDLLLDTMQRAREGREVPTVSLMRTLGMQVWLKAAEQEGICRQH